MEYHAPMVKGDPLHSPLNLLDEYQAPSGISCHATQFLKSSVMFGVRNSNMQKTNISASQRNRPCKIHRKIHQGILVGFTMLALFLSGCSQSKTKEKASALASAFFDAIRTSDVSKAKDLYKGFANFGSYLKSDSVTVKDVLINDTLARVRLMNHFTNGLGKQSNEVIWLYMRQLPGDSLKIIDSKGLSSHSEDEDYIFGLKTGCIDATKDTLDQAVLKSMIKANKVKIVKAVDLWMELSNGCVVEDWSWETGYSGSASGKGIIRNNTTFSIPKLKYQITFKDSNGNEVTTDDGYVGGEAIEAGRSKSFTTYTSYVGKASRASVKLTFDDALLLKYVVESEWTGTECSEYFSEHPEVLERLEMEPVSENETP